MSTDSKRILITGGRAPVALDLARCFKKAGHEIYVAESMEKNLCSFSNVIEACYLVPKPREDEQGFIKAIAHICKMHHIDLVVPTCEETFYLAKHKKNTKLWDTQSSLLVSTNVSGEDFQTPRIFVEDISLLERLHHKYKFINDLKLKGILVPSTTMVKSKEELYLCVNSYFNQYESVILKPVYSRFGSKVIRLSEGDRPPEKMRISESEPWVVQAYIEGRQICVYAICDKGVVKAFSAYSSSFTSGMGTSLHFKNVKDLSVFEWLKTTARGYGYTGQISFDLIQTETGELYPIECNPRTTSGVHLLTTDDQFHKCFFENNLAKCHMPEEGERAMLFLPMLLLGLGQVRQLEDLNNWFMQVYSSREVIFSFKDLRPFWGQFLLYTKLMRIGRQKNMTPVEASTYDIEWNGE